MSHMGFAIVLVGRSVLDGTWLGIVEQDLDESARGGQSSTQRR